MANVAAGHTSSGMIQMGVQYGNHSGDDPSVEAFDNLFPALLQCFALIFAGYFAGRINLVTQSQGRGIGIFVGR